MIESDSTARTRPETTPVGAWAARRRDAEAARIRIKTTVSRRRGTKNIVAPPKAHVGPDRPTPGQLDPEGRVTAGLGPQLRGRWSGAGGEEVERRARGSGERGVRGAECLLGDDDGDAGLATLDRGEGDPGGQALPDAGAVAVILRMVV